jgi:small subunit ribosomal protein S20
MAAAGLVSTAGIGPGCDIGASNRYHRRAVRWPGAVISAAGSGTSVPSTSTLRTSREPMANIKSQIKRNRQNEERRLRNKAVRSELKTRVKRAVTTAEGGDETAADDARLAVKRLDKAAAKGIIHKNQAARRKSRLMKRLAKAES